MPTLEMELGLESGPETEDDDVDYGDSHDWDNDDREEFADPGGRSALRAETEDNPRIFPCPNCDKVSCLTAKDRALGYQCDTCADQAERGGY